MKAELQRIYISGFVGRFWGSGTNACEHSCLKLCSHANICKYFVYSQLFGEWLLQVTHCCKEVTAPNTSLRLFWSLEDCSGCLEVAWKVTICLQTLTSYTNVTQMGNVECTVYIAFSQFHCADQSCLVSINMNFLTGC